MKTYPFFVMSVLSLLISTFLTLSESKAIDANFFTEDRFEPLNKANYGDGAREGVVLPANSYCHQLEYFQKNSVWELKVSEGFKGDYIVVDKGRRLIHLLYRDHVIRTYRMALGGNPIGHKIQSGDNKTPEGVYKISIKNPGSDYHLSLKVDYPNEADQAFARKIGVSPGGDIMIHGLPNDPLKRWFINHPSSNWTRGCMAVYNGEVDEIYRVIDKETPIEICK